MEFQNSILSHEVPYYVVYFLYFHTLFTSFHKIGKIMKQFYDLLVFAENIMQMLHDTTSNFNVKYYKNSNMRCYLHASKGFRKLIRTVC